MLPDSGDAGMACAIAVRRAPAMTRAAPPAWMKARRLGLHIMIDPP
jgi:hypothetical protein